MRPESHPAERQSVVPRRSFLGALAAAGLAPQTSGQRAAVPPAPRRVFITGSTDGLGLAAARSLIDQGHAVLLHARSKERAASIDATVKRALGIVIGDLGRCLQPDPQERAVRRRPS
jgi:hypothetical protein